jgi:DHA1 family multidrug resistance protein-like MFS transporter
VASFVVWAGFGAVLPYLPVFLQEQANASVALIGIIAAAYYVGTFSLSSFKGSLSDRVGRKPLLVSGVALFAVSSLLFTTTTRPGWFILFRFLEGVGAAAVTPTAQAFVADVSSEDKRSRAYGWLISAQFGGLVAGPPLAIVLYSLGGGQGKQAFYAIFLFGAVMAALVAVALLSTIKEPEHIRLQREDDAQRPPYRQLVTRPIAAFLVIAFTGNFAMGAWEVLWSLWLRELGASMAIIGLTWMAFSAPMLLSFLGGRLADRGNRFVLMYTGLGIAAVAWIVYGVTRNLSLFIAFNLIEGFSFAVALPASKAFLVQVSPARWLGAVQGLENSSMQFAALVGTLTAPLLFSAISGYTLAVGGLLAVVGLVVTAPILGGEWRRIAAAERLTAADTLATSERAGPTPSAEGG